jgi:hypothetical protein
MKANANKYQSVVKLPANAMTVSDYAKQENITTTTVYTRLARGTDQFKIVTFHTINFVIPIKKNANSI